MDKIQMRIELINKVFKINTVLYVKAKYSPTHANILEGKIGLEELEGIQKLCTCKHGIDRRTPHEFAKALIVNWVFEDMCEIELLPRLFHAVKKNGADKDREFLKQSKTSSESDFTVVKGVERVKVELVADFGGFWKKSKVINFRDNKALKLAEQKAIVVAVDMMNNKVAVIDMGEVKDSLEETYIFQWNKKGHKLAITPDMFKEWSVF